MSYRFADSLRAGSGYDLGRSSIPDRIKRLFCQSEHKHLTGTCPFASSVGNEALFLGVRWPVLEAGHIPPSNVLQNESGHNVMPSWHGV